MSFTDSAIWDDLTNTYLPPSGEGENMATQAMTAVCKLMYKWYNDGDVYDNTAWFYDGMGNDLTSYANWLYKNCGGSDIPDILEQVYKCNGEDYYEQIIEELCVAICEPGYLDRLAQLDKHGSVYNCSGPFKIEWYDEEEDEEW